MTDYFEINDDSLDLTKAVIEILELMGENDNVEGN